VHEIARKVNTVFKPGVHETKTVVDQAIQQTSGTFKKMKDLLPLLKKSDPPKTELVSVALS
jgi:hypothetical protein